MEANKLVSIFVVLVVISTLWNAFFIIYQTSKLTAKVSGTASLCIDEPPILEEISCDTNLTQGVAFSCTLNATDADNDSLSFSSEFITNRTVFNISSFGVISFTPVNDDVGNHSVNITVDDLKGCDISTDSQIFNFSVDNVNDPPELVTDIPDQSFTEGNTIVFFLTDYFVDPDGDAMTFSVSITSDISITITNSEVLITADDCPATESVIFTATDTSNQSTDSNVVTIECNEASSGSESGGSSGGSGGGGGGGSTLLSDCETELECFDWTECYENGTQSRNCLDLAGCTDRILVIWRECTYYGQCFNGIQDENEEGLDCGGPCTPCISCFDGIQNQGETGVDCGGPCGVCLHCTDGIQNFDEEGIDCGGSSCDPCPSCFDDIQNQGEFGVDCGGPCAPCSQIETPDVIQENNFIRIISWILLIIIALLVTYRYTHKYVDKQVVKLIKEHTKSRYTFFSSEKTNSYLDSLNKIKELDVGAKTDALTELSREFIADLFSIKKEFITQEVNSLASKLPKPLAIVFDNYTSKIVDLEISKLKTDTELNCYVELLRQIILSVSPYSKDLVRREFVELKPEKDANTSVKIFTELTNLLVALQFREFKVAEDKYRKIHGIYSEAGSGIKEIVYPIMNAVYWLLDYEREFHLYPEKEKSLKPKKITKSKK